MVIEDKIVLNRQKYDIQEMKKFHDKVNKSGMTNEWKLVAMATNIFRGKAKDTNTFIGNFVAISDRDNLRIKKDLLGDKDASEQDEFGNFTYSGIGKTGGLKTYATLSQQASDDAIDKFFVWLKTLKKPMDSVKEKMSKRFSINWKKEI